MKLTHRGKSYLKRILINCTLGASLPIIVGIISQPSYKMFLKLLIILPLTIVTLGTPIMAALYFYNKYKWNNGKCRHCNAEWKSRWKIEDLNVIYELDLIYMCDCQIFTPSFIFEYGEKYER